MRAIQKEVSVRAVRLVRLPISGCVLFLAVALVLAAPARRASAECYFAYDFSYPICEPDYSEFDPCQIDPQLCAPPPAPAPAPLVLDDGSVYYPAPNTELGVQDELHQNTRVECEGDDCYSGMEPADADAIAFQMATESDASLTTVEPGAEVATKGAAEPAKPIDKLYHKDESFGNSRFGGGYALDASLNAYPATDTHGAQLRAMGEGRAFATVLGKNLNVTRATVSAVADQTAGNNLSAALYVVGQEIWSKSYGASGIPDSGLGEYPLFNREFFESSAYFSVWGIPIRVTVGANGSAGVKLYGYLSEAGINLVAAPESGVYGVASAAVDIYVAAIGVEGTLTLIKATLPTTLSLVAASCGDVDWKLATDLVGNTLSGKLSVFVKIRLLFIKKKKSIKIADWKGETRNWNLFTDGSHDPMNFACTDTLLASIAGTARPPVWSPPPPPPPTPPRERLPRPQPCGGRGRCAIP
jgi:hypothetical protein